METFIGPQPRLASRPGAGLLNPSDFTPSIVDGKAEEAEECVDPTLEPSVLLFYLFNRVGVAVRLLVRLSICC